MKRILKIFILEFFLLFSCLAFAQENEFGLHLVKDGETLYSIARSYYITVADIKEVNKNIENDNIKVGQEIFIPKTVRNSSMFSDNKNTLDEQALFPSKKKTKEKTQKINKNRINIAMMLPLFYDDIDELSFNQYNIEEKKIQNNRKPYKCFSYISFYEGARIALDKLEKQGCKVSLYVFDVGDDVEKMNKALEYPEIKNMDLIIPLVFKNSFEVLSTFAKQNHIPLVNPMSTAESILDNEFVFKIQPSETSEAKTIMTYISEKYKNSQIIVLFDDANTPNDVLKWYKENISNYAQDDSWTMLNYRKNATKLKNYLKQGKKNIIINIVESKNVDYNKTYSNKILQSLSALKGSYDIMLFGQPEWLDYNNIDYTCLDKVDFHFTRTYLNDYTNPNFVSFVKDYRKHFKTEPDKIYAALGYDIMTYFVLALREKDKEFLKNPNIKGVQDMINHYRFKKAKENFGWENETSTIYKVYNYKIQSEWSY